MPRKSIRTCESPRGRGREKPEPRRSLFARLLLVLSMLGLSGLVTSALAQSEPPPRMDPGTEVENGGAGGEGWKIFSIPGLASNARLGDVWASADGHVYVWAIRPGTAALEDPGEGDRLPGGERNPRDWSSTLYRFDGTQWTAVLQTPNETGGTIQGSECHHLFASTTGPQGAAQLYSFDGNTWTRLTMPGTVPGRLHTLAGVPGDTWFRVDRFILHHDGARLEKIFELPAGDATNRGLFYLGPQSLLVVGTSGHWIYDQGTWSEVPAGFTFGDVEDAWGMVDTNGFLRVYVLASGVLKNGLNLWHFQETDRVTHAGTWTACFADPCVVGAGLGLHLWGVADNEIYATGVVEGAGHMLRYDGVSWQHLVAPATLGTVHGVWGTPEGSVWFSTESGSVIRYQRGNSAPDLTAARPTVDRLWPDDHRLVRVDITGIVDPNGDAVTVKIERVLEDEDPSAGALAATCPDAVMATDHVALRAEHADNGDGRTYVIEYTATDRLGAVSRGLVSVCAPHYLDTPCGPDPGVFDALAPCPAPDVDRGPFDADEMRGSLRVHYQLAEPARVHLGIYDVAGRLQATISEGAQNAGAHETTWDMRGLTPGMYFVKLRGPGIAHVRRVVVWR